MISCGARKDDEGVYEEYTTRRTDAAPCEIMGFLTALAISAGLQQKREFYNGLIGSRYNLIANNAYTSSFLSFPLSRE